MAKKQEETLLTVVEKTALTIPEGLEAGTEGLEHITRADVKLPQLKIAQSTTDEVKPDNPNYNRDLRQGDFFNGLLGTIYGRGPLEFCFIRGDAPHYIEFVPREQGSGVRDFNVPAGDPRTQFTIGPDGKSVKPVAAKIYDFVILLLPSDTQPDHELLTMSLSSMGIKVATHINGLLMSRRHPVTKGPLPIFAGKYTMQSVSKQAPKGPFYGHLIKNAGLLSTEDLQIARSQYLVVKDKVLDIERVPENDDFPEPGSEG